jgi:hypothetical protein
MKTIENNLHLFVLKTCRKKSIDTCSIVVPDQLFEPTYIASFLNLGVSSGTGVA